jgi:hypothetical protein
VHCWNKTSVQDARYIHTKKNIHYTLSGWYHTHPSFDTTFTLTCTIAVSSSFGNSFTYVSQLFTLSYSITWLTGQLKLKNLMGTDVLHSPGEVSIHLQALTHQTNHVSPRKVTTADKDRQSHTHTTYSIIVWPCMNSATGCALCIPQRCSRILPHSELAIPN